MRKQFKKLAARSFPNLARGGQDLEKQPGRKHPYHMVEQSPWPILASGAAFLVVLGLTLQFHGEGCSTTIVGLLFATLVLWGWWRDVLDEATYGKKHTPLVQRGIRYGVALFIASEALLFASFFALFFTVFLAPSAAIGHVWPPKGITTIPAFGLPYLNTLLLLLSATALTWSHASLLENRLAPARQGLWITIVLGGGFLVVQGIEYAHAPFALSDGVYGALFYILTGFHGAHVLVGLIYLIVNLNRLRAGHITAHNHLGYEAAAWYWHFVDVVWLFLFIFLYWQGS